MTDATRLKLPIDRYLWSASETTTLHQAEDAMIATCLRQFDMTLPAPPTTDDLAPESPTARRYGMTSMSEARRYGYRLPAALSAPGQQPSPATEDDRVLGVITGAVTTVAGKSVPQGGCAGQADREIGHGAPVGVADQAQDVNGRAWELARDDPRVQSGFAAWSNCMRAAGYTYPDPIAPMNDSGFSGVPTEIEKAVAAADVGCKDKTNVTGIWYAYDVAYQEALIEAHRADFAQILGEKSTQLAASRAVLEQG